MTDSYKINDQVRIFIGDTDSEFLYGTVKHVEHGIVTLLVAMDGLTYTFDDDESVVLNFDDDAGRYYWAVNIAKLKESS